MVNKRGRQKKCVKIFLNFTNLHKTQPGQKTVGTFPNFMEDIYAPDVWVPFGYPDLDAGLNTSQFGGDIAFSIRQHRPRLAKPCSRHFKSGDKAS